MSDGAHNRDGRPVPSADESHSATSSFDLVQRANKGEGPALEALLRLTAQHQDPRSLLTLVRSLGRFRDPRVTAAFQYTFRDDPVFPVGLADVSLTRTWPAYTLWLAWGGERDPRDPEPALPAACAP